MKMYVDDIPKKTFTCRAITSDGEKMGLFLKYP